MKISKVREVKTPTRANTDDAGIDFYVPEFTEQFLKDLESKNGFVSIIKDESMKPLYINLGPQERILIPSGIHVNFKDEANSFRNIINNKHLSNYPVGLGLIAHNKSGVGSKKGLDRLAEVVDESYQGEVHISIVNTGNEKIKILPNEKLIQFLLIPIFYSNVEEITFNELYNETSTRGADGFGSTNNK